jgi:hypothetical protein
MSAVWVKGSYQLDDWIAAAPDAESVALLAGGLLALIVALVMLPWPDEIAPADVQLTPVGLGGVVVALAVSLLIRALEGAYTGNDVLLTLGLAGLSALVLWFERRPRGRTLLDAHVPPQRPAPGNLMAAVILPVVAYAFVWTSTLFQEGGEGPLFLIVVSFVIIGFAWVPLVLMALAVRAVNRQGRKLDIL